jgi:predicted transcriptional regulator
MAPRTKTLYFQLDATERSFVSKLLNEKGETPYADLELLRNILTREKARILATIKAQNPKSIYQLSTLLKRDQKSVRRDLKILERFGFVDFEAKRVGKKTSHKPFLIVNKMILEISV